MLTFSFLTREFYRDYSKCKEIEQKIARPYIQVEIIVNGILFAVPLRSHINHPHVLWTDKENHCGVDFSKAVVITDPERYINRLVKPHIRSNEFDALRGKEYIIKKKLEKYISEYKKAKEHLEIPRNKVLVKYSTLQYFEDYL